LLELYVLKQQVIHQLALDGDPNLRDCGLVACDVSGTGVARTFVSPALSCFPEVVAAVKALQKLVVKSLRPGISIADVREELSGEMTVGGIPTLANLESLTGRAAAAAAAPMIYRFMARTGDSPSKWRCWCNLMFGCPHHLKVEPT
jgi:2-methylaconitate cis-trans-isomerase PrpF